MKQELQEVIYKKYPNIFRDRTRSMQETCMCWGLDCGDGWLELIDMFCQIATLCQDKYKCEVIMDQVKEKFGSLRLYHRVLGKEYNKVNIAADLLGALETLLELASMQCCENCGDRWNPSYHRTGSWIYTLCDKCYENTKSSKLAKK